MATVAEDIEDPAALTVWIADDRAKQRKVIADSFEAIGATTEREGSIAEIGQRVRDVEDEGAEPPEVIVIDQHWDLGISNLALLGRPDIPVRSRSEIGAALARYFRSRPKLDNSILLMTLVNENEVASPPPALAPLSQCPNPSS